jgi:hypothetical protein
VRVFAATVLTAEAFVIFFGTIVAAHLSAAPAGVAWAVGSAFAVCCLLVCGLLRSRWGYRVGSALQLAVVASGVLVRTMFVLGAIFAGLWIAALWYGRKLDVLRARSTAEPT